MGILDRFRKERTTQSQREREEAMSRALTDALRMLSSMLKKAADSIEEKRLEEKGYRTNEQQFLERSNKPKDS
jgi:hypothetical protein